MNLGNTYFFHTFLCTGRNALEVLEKPSSGHSYFLSGGGSATVCMGL